ncbi:MAG: hypothetical protein UHD09_08975, partial [Bifidobacterium sp.]|nr:hypothetical protein [Bifidobacterium sp.]
SSSVPKPPTPPAGAARRAAASPSAEETTAFAPVDVPAETTAAPTSSTPAATIAHADEPSLDDETMMSDAYPAPAEGPATVAFTPLDNEPAPTAAFAPVAADAGTADAAPADDGESVGETTQSIPPVGEAATTAMPAAAATARSSSSAASAGETTVTMPPLPAPPALRNYRPAVSPDTTSFAAIDDGDAKVAEATGKVDVAAHESAASRAKARKRKRIVIAVIAAVVVVALAVGGFFWWRAEQARNTHEAALESCQQAQPAATSAYEALDAQVKASLKTASVTADQVADASTLNALNASLSSARSTLTGKEKITAACDASLSTTALQQGARQLGTQEENMQAMLDQLKQDDAAVSASKASKQRATLKDELMKSVDEAQQEYDSTEGALNDDSSRQALLQAIQDATTAANDANISKESVADQQKKLSEAIAAVQAEYQAEQAAAAEAARQQAAAQEAARQQALQQQTQQQAQQQAQQQLQQQTTTNNTTTGNTGTGTGTTGTTGNTGTDNNANNSNNNNNNNSNNNSNGNANSNNGSNNSDSGDSGSNNANQ